ncbi:putative ABC transporter, permease protein [Bifidobacterium gallicum DSM 20093 = LMG 11596]|nr:putative ABC transporter, permease protein [Bifidobacterium gallicum DSM 20093 = LMG 11596]
MDARQHSRKHATMLNAAFLTDTWRSWRHAVKPFLSIMIIAMLGVTVLTGMYAGCRDAFLAANKYYQTQGLHDIQIASTLGLDDDDVTAVRSVEGVEAVQAERSQTVQIESGDVSKPAVITMIGTNGLDQPSLQRGRMPTKWGEAAVTETLLKKTGLKLGQRMRVKVPQDPAVTGIPDELTIVGVVLPADDLANPDGYRASNSFRATANTALPVYVPPEGLSGAAYTALSLRVDGTQYMDSFSDEYDEAVDQVRKRIDDDVKTQREQARADTLREQAQRELDDAKATAVDEATTKALDEALEQAKEQAKAQVLVQAGVPGASALVNGGTAGTSGTAGSGTAAETGGTAGSGTAAETGTGATADVAARMDAVVAANPALRQAVERAQAQVTLPDDVKTRIEQQVREQVDEQFAKETAEQQRQIDAIKPATWYVQTRSALSGVSSLDSDISSMQKIGNAFPIVFLVVAVMMSLTTMTRLVEEDRGFVGTYLGLGYSGRMLVMRYLLFAVLACLIGGGLGLLIGFLGIPAFLMLVIHGLYAIPHMTLQYDWLVGSLGVLLFVVAVGAAAVAAAMRETGLSPAVLMRPKAPRAGSRILLERIKPLWSRMSFLSKVTARNIFRFKSRLIMTLGGVAGCTALIICGLAINDTVNRLGVAQFEGAYHYDVTVVANNGQILDDLRKSGDTTASMDASVNAGTVEYDGSSTTVQVIVVPDAQKTKLNQMFALRPERCSGHCEAAVLNDSGVIATQSGVQTLGVHAGADVDLQVGSSKPQQVHVESVVHNLIGADVYMTQQLYESLYGAEPTWNAIYADLDMSDEQVERLVDQLNEDHDVITAASTAHQAKTFRFDLMGAIVVLITMLAGALALVVLFTLANTNVSERLREMATLKVLGFYDREVHHYVNREMRIITVMGIVLGLPLGWWISGLLTSALNMPGLYFEVYVSPWSYAFAVVATMAFALLVQLFVNPVLDRIDPVTSLKSVE